MDFPLTLALPQGERELTPWSFALLSESRSYEH
jgi:hypothetical protein